MKKYLILFSLCIIQMLFHPVFAQKKGKKIKVVTHSDAYYVSFPKNSSATNVDAYMLGLAHPVTFLVNVKRGTRIRAQITTMPEAGNIRINRMVMPNGSTDGPFSRTINYPISQKGTYKLIVGGSNMQGDDWKGSFRLHVAVL